MIDIMIAVYCLIWVTVYTFLSWKFGFLYVDKYVFKDSVRCGLLTIPFFFILMEIVSLILTNNFFPKPIMLGGASVVVGYLGFLQYFG